uniref:Uncharacterized protein n=1 Tax=Rhipicephalus zambeziensis TaxID=60191 RepID=A0A224YEQ7_9ACAR
MVRLTNSGNGMGICTAYASSNRRHDRTDRPVARPCRAPPPHQNVQFSSRPVTFYLFLSQYSGVLMCLGAIDNHDSRSFFEETVVVLPANRLFSWVCCEVFVTFLGQVRVEKKYCLYLDVFWSNCGFTCMNGCCNNQWIYVRSNIVCLDIDIIYIYV